MSSEKSLDEPILGLNGGAWSAATHATYYRNNLNAGLVHFITKYLRPRNFLEFGSGEGVLATAVAKENSLDDSFCIEPLIKKDPGELNGLQWLNIDVTEDVALPDVLERQFDLVMSIEVVEHIPIEHHERIFDFLASRTNRVLLFSGAREGQGGHGHIATRPESEWRKAFQQRGLLFDPVLTVIARKLSDVKNINHCLNLQVFLRVD